MILISGSRGLIGSEAVAHSDRQGHRVLAVGNNIRWVFLGAQDGITLNLEHLKSATKNFQHFSPDIRHRSAQEELLRAHRIDLIVHCAAQSSHDKARDISILDFEVNALGTLNFLEATRQCCSEAGFLFMSRIKCVAQHQMKFCSENLRSAAISQAMIGPQCAWRGQLSRADLKN